MPAPEQIRKDNLNRERKLREYILLLESLFICISGAGVAFLIADPNRQIEFLVVVGAASLCAVFGLFIAWGIYRMQPWTRRPLTCLCIAGLLFFPFGTLLSLLILQITYLGEPPQLLTSDYFDVVCKTKHLNPRTSFLTWIGVVLLVVLLVAIVVISLLPRDVRIQ